MMEMFGSLFGRRTPDGFVVQEPDDKADAAGYGVTATEIAIRQQEARKYMAQNNFITTPPPPDVFAEMARRYAREDIPPGEIVLKHASVTKIENGFLIRVAFSEGEVAKVYYAESIEKAAEAMVAAIVAHRVDK